MLVKPLILHFSHMPRDSNYGATNSLRLHCQIMEDDGDFRIQTIYMRRPRSFLTELVSGKNGSHALPFSFNYDAHFQNPITIGKFLASYLLFQIGKCALAREIIDIEPTIIHLNSLVLVSLIPFLRRLLSNRKVKIIAHVRELLSPHLSAREIALIKLLDGLICIDESTKRQLNLTTKNAIPDQKITIITNPFSADLSYKEPEILSHIKKLDHNNFIFAIVGKISSDKGVIFVCEAFLEANLNNAQLIIAGTSSGQYFQEFLQLVRRCPQQLLYAGEIDNLAQSGFYTIVDCVVRGDESFRTGRTVYEGLYAQASVIMVGTPQDLESDHNLSKFSDRILLYPPRNKAQLIKQMQMVVATKKKLDNTLPTNNFADYRQSIKEFYYGIIADSV